MTADEIKLGRMVSSTPASVNLTNNTVTTVLTGNANRVAITLACDANRISASGKGISFGVVVGGTFFTLAVLTATTCSITLDITRIGQVIQGPIAAYATAEAVNNVVTVTEHVLEQGAGV